MKSLLTAIPLCITAFTAIAGCPENTQLYARGWSIPAPTNGQRVHMQAWNKGTQNIYITSVSIGSTTDTDFSILLTQNRLAHPLTSFGAHDEGGINGSGNISTNGEIRVMIDPGIIGGVIVNGQVLKGDMFSYSMSNYQVPPGRGIMIRLGLTNTFLRGNFAWCE